LKAPDCKWQTPIHIYLTDRSCFYIKIEMKVKETLKWARNGGNLIIASFKAFMEDRALTMSAALAYYTVFAMAPLLIMFISLASFFYGEDAINRKLFQEINGLVGNQAALQIQDIIIKIKLQSNSTFAVILGVIILFIGTTGVFIEMQESINQIWRVKAKPKKGWEKMLINRVLSFSMIISLGFLLIASLIINGLILALSDRLSQYFPDLTIFLINYFNVGLTFMIISALFAIIVFTRCRNRLERCPHRRNFHGHIIYCRKIFNRDIYRKSWSGLCIWRSRLHHCHSGVGLLYIGNSLFRCRIYPGVFRMLWWKN
jgi:uncharacterized BrkB/YihY/UPF0761 family membrane protein